MYHRNLHAHGRDDRDLPELPPTKTQWLGVAVLILGCLIACGETADPVESLNTGLVLFKSGDMAAAVIELKNAVQGAPDNAEARLALGKASLGVGDAAGALKEFKRARSLGLASDELNLSITRALIDGGNMSEAAVELALSSNGSSAAWMTLQGSLDLAVGRFEEAQNGFKRAIELEPDNVEARRGAVSAAIGLGETDQARAFIDAALVVTQEDFEIWLLKGNLDRHDKKYNEAIEAFTKALEIIPQSPVALLHRATAKVAALDNDGALEDLKAIGKASNEDPRALYVRAVIANQKNQPTAALRYLRQVLHVLPNHRDSLVQAAQLHFKLNQHSEAENYLNRLLVIDPANEGYRRMLGAVQLADGRLDTGIGDMENVDIDSLSDPRLLALLGTAYLKHGKISDGTRSLERAHELAPDSIPIRTQLALSKMRAGRLPEALAELAAIRKEAPDSLFAGILQAFGFASKQNEKRALIIANELIDQQPDLAIVYNVRGYLHDIFKEPEKATKDFETALEKDPNFHPASFNLARLAIKANDKPSARTRLRLILDESPNQPQALLFLAALFQQEGNDSEALKLWEQARANNPDAVEPRIYLARHHRQEKNSTAAQSMAEEAYKLAPYSPAAQFEYAISKMSSGNAEDAVPVIKAMVERFPNSEQALELLAQAYNQSGDADALMATLVELVDRFPDGVKTRIALARLHLKNKNFDAARKLAAELIARDGEQGDGYTLQGDINFAEGAMPDALAAYDKAHELNPTTQSLLKLYAVHQQTGGDAKMLDEWLTDHGDDVAVRVTKAMADISAGRQSEAIFHYEKILETAPGHIIALNNLAWIFDENGDERAIDFARRAYEAAPSRAEIADTYGWIMLRKGNTEQAVELLSTAIAGAPENSDIRYHFASALANSGDDQGAVRELETILSKEASFPSRAEAASLLDKLRR